MQHAEGAAAARLIGQSDVYKGEKSVADIFQRIDRPGNLTYKTFRPGTPVLPTLAAIKTRAKSLASNRIPTRRIHRCLHARGELQFAQDVLDMNFDGGLGNVELPGNQFVAVA